MRMVLGASIAAAAALFLAGTTSSPVEAKKKAKAKTSCAMAVGEGTGITEQLARTNAGNSFNQIVSRVGGKQRGAVKTTCKKTVGGLVNTCETAGRICK